MALEVREAPGSIGQVAVCPYCSKGYLVEDARGNPLDDAPSKCKRCGAPMDIKAAKAFAKTETKAQAIRTGKVVRDGD